MRKLISFFILFLLVINMIAQPPRKFYCKYGGDGVDIGYGVKQCLDTNYIIVGSTTSFGAGSSDIYLLKIDSMGQFIWQKTFGGFNQDVGKSIALLPDGGFVITGYSSSYGAGGYDVITIRTDKFGNQLWLRSFGGLDWDFGNDVIIGPDGNIVVCGSTYSYGYGSRDGLVLKYDLNGNLLWNKTFGGTLDDELNSIIKTNDNMLATCGQTKSFGEPNGDSYFIKLDLNGDTIFTKKFGGNGVDYWNDLIQFTSGNYILVGATTNTAMTVTQSNKILYSSTGTILDIALNHNSNNLNESWTSISKSVLNQNYFAHIRNIPVPAFATEGNIFMHKTSFTYPTIVNSFAGTLDENFYNLEPTYDGGYVSVGKTISFGSISEDIMFFKFDSVIINYSSIIGLKEINKTFSDISFNVKNDELTIRTNECINKIEIYDIQGNILINLTNIDTNETIIKIDKLQKGIYFSRIKNCKNSYIVKKILLE